MGEKMDYTEAAYWVPTEDEHTAFAAVTVGTRYPLHFDPNEGYFVVDDRGEASTIFLVHGGFYERKRKGG